MALWVPHIAIVVLTAAAAITDTRSGIIPNSLTLPPLIAAPAVFFLALGPTALLGSLLGALLCGAGPYLLFRRGALGGGDVKLFAAIGAIAGATLGLEVQILGLCAGALYATARLLCRGELLRVLGNAGRMMVNSILPARLRKETTPQSFTHVRLGASIFAGTLLAVAGQHGAWG
jgi:prepilin peptidase CpaA